MTAAVPCGIGAALCRWKRKILALHTADGEEQSSAGTVFTSVSLLPLGFLKHFQKKTCNNPLKPEIV
jgi:hypothetical protein